MFRSPLPAAPRALFVASLVIATGLAGCASEQGMDDSSGASSLYASFQEAMAAPGRVYEPEQHTGGTDAHLKLLRPADPDNVAEGETDVVIVLFDGSTNAPLETAFVEIEAEMPAMGHGTSGEQAPVHDAHGVYEGLTNFIMPGNWIVNIDASLTTGERFHFEIPMRVNN